MIVDDRLYGGLSVDQVSKPDWADAAPRPQLDPAARHGLVGEIVEKIESETEADPNALLFTFLVAFGNAVGPASRARVGDDDHPGRLSVAIVANTASGKGQSLSAVRPILRAADEDWWRAAHCSGFASGEAVIARLSGRHAAEGSAIEKRAFVIEPEFARLLSVNARDGSTLSPIIRGAWDDGRLQMIRAKDTLLAEAAHVSMLAHITPDELRAKLSSTEVASGFANRILFVFAQRGEKLPSGGNVPPDLIAALAARVRKAMEFGRQPQILRRTRSAEILWDEFYRAEPDRYGIVGAITARAHPQKLRLSVLYALLDLSHEIAAEHVLAAEAAWRFCAASAEHIFGGALGSGAQDRILEAARAAYPKPLDGTDIRDLFARKKSAEELSAARAALAEMGLIRVEFDNSTGGRQRTLIYALRRDQSDKSRQNRCTELLSRLRSLWSPAPAEEFS